MRLANLALRFLLELCTFAALVYWGAELDAPLGVKLALAVGAPSVAIAIWGRWVAPKAPARLADPARLRVELLVFAAGAAALALAGQAAPAAILAAAVALNETLLGVWGQRETA